MNVQFKLMRRSGDKAYILSEITGYDERLPVVLTASTEAGIRIPSDTFPYCDEKDAIALEAVLFDGALASDEDLPSLHTKNSAEVRFFVIVLPWMRIRRYELEFRAIDSSGTIVNSCKNKLDLEAVKWMSRFAERINHLEGQAIENLDGRFIHDRIHVSFVRALDQGDSLLVSASLQMPYHEESSIEFDFLGDHGQPLLMDHYIIEDSITHGVDYGSFERRHMIVSFTVDRERPEVCFCATDTAGSIAPGFAMLGAESLRELTDDFEEKTKGAFEDEKYDQWYNEVHKADLPTLLEQVSSRFEKAPLFSMVCLLKSTPTHHLHDIISSLLTQSYGRWELIFVNMSGDDQSVVDVLNTFDDDRIYLLDVERDLSTAEKINAGVLAAEGDFIGMVRACDKIAPDTLFELVRSINEFSDCDMIYCDMDTFDADGVHSEPVFRPDFSPELLRSYNYLQGFIVIRSKLLLDVGFLSKDFSGALAYDFILRATEKARRVCHVPRVLYHRRYASTVIENELFSDFEQEAGRKALVEHCRRIGLNAEVLTTSMPFHYHVRHVLIDAPRVTIVIPSEDNAELLDSCIRSIYAKVSYKNFEVVIVDVASKDPATFACYEALKQRFDTLTVLEWDYEFNRARIANFAAENTTGDFLLFLNDDTRIITGDALEVMLGYFQSPQVGIVGPKELFVDGTIEHAGLVVGGSRILNPLSRYMSPQWRGYLDRAVVAQNVSAVTGDCMLVSRNVFKEVGGFTDDFSILYSDVDFCLKAREIGYYTVYTPHVSLTHFQSVSRVRSYSKALRIKMKREAALLQYFWPCYFVEGDAFYNPNLDPDSPYFALKH